MKYSGLTNLARLLITCPDRPGIIATVSSFLRDHGANITDSDQHSTDPEGGTFFMRIEFQTQRVNLSHQCLGQRFHEEVASPLKMQWGIHYAANYKRMAIMVSNLDHALVEVLWRWSRQELPMNIPFIISNHLKLLPIAKQFQIPFHYIPITADTKLEAEQQLLELCHEQVDGIILARYMQILTDKVISQYPNKIINIHHSFLPAFVGANPYKQAYEHGVKLIGATAHYVTSKLDMGPIIDQDVIRVSHRFNPKKLRELGQYVERTVLARAVAAHIEDRIIVHANKTIVFNENI